jgi:quercetin dioxygenase-like cupin family protein
LIIDHADGYEPEKDWKRGRLCNQATILIEHFAKPQGQATPRHQQPNTWVLIVLKDERVITTDEDEQKFSENDVVFIPATKSIL